MFCFPHDRYWVVLHSQILEHLLANSCSSVCLRDGNTSTGVQDQTCQHKFVCKSSWQRYRYPKPHLDGSILQSSKTYNPSPSWQYFMGKSNRTTSCHDWLDSWMEVLVFCRKVALIPAAFEQLMSYSRRHILGCLSYSFPVILVWHIVYSSAVNMLNYTQNGSHINF